MIVEIAFAYANGVPARLRGGDGGEHSFHRRLAVAAGDGGEFARKAAPRCAPLARPFAESENAIACDDLSQCDTPRRARNQSRRRAVFSCVGDEVVAVNLFAAQGDKHFAVFDFARINACAANLRVAVADDFAVAQVCDLRGGCHFVNAARAVSASEKATRAPLISWYSS